MKIKRVIIFSIRTRLCQLNMRQFLMVTILFAISGTTKAQISDSLIFQVSKKYNEIKSIHYESDVKVLYENKTDTTYIKYRNVVFTRDVRNNKTHYTYSNESIIDSIKYNTVYNGKLLLHISYSDSVAKIFDYEKVHTFMIDPFSLSGSNSYYVVVSILDKILKNERADLVNEDKDYVEVTYKTNKFLINGKVHEYLGSNPNSYYLKIDKHKLSILKFTQSIYNKNGLTYSSESVYMDIVFNDSTKHINETIPDSFKIRGFRNESNNYQMGNLIPNFVIEPIGKESYMLDAHRGEVLLLEFTSVNCGHCIQAAPFINRLDSIYKGKQLKIISFYLNSSPKINTGCTYLGKKNDIVQNNKGIFLYFGIQAYPTYIFIDKTGKISDLIEGYLPVYDQRMIEIIKRLSNDSDSAGIIKRLDPTVVIK